jgi:hypothetical protein
MPPEKRKRASPKRRAAKTSQGSRPSKSPHTSNGVLVNTLTNTAIKYIVSLGGVTHARNPVLQKHVHAGLTKCMSFATPSHNNGQIAQMLSIFFEECPDMRHGLQNWYTDDTQASELWGRGNKLFTICFAIINRLRPSGNEATNPGNFEDRMPNVHWNDF